MRSIYQVPRSADVVIVDQFEELFTLTDDDAVQREFVRVLLASVNDGIRRAVISLRADFYGNCMRVPELAGMLARRQVVVGAMSERELRTVITQPAERAGLVVDGELVDAIVAEAANHPGALPLVSHALVETWRRRTDLRLTLDAYREAGSIAGAIARTAENVYGGFTSEQRVQTQRLLVRLVEPGEGSEHTRRRVPFAQLEGSTIDRRVVDVLIESATADRRRRRRRDRARGTHRCVAPPELLDRGGSRRAPYSIATSPQRRARGPKSGATRVSCIAAFGCRRRCPGSAMRHRTSRRWSAISSRRRSTYPRSSCDSNNGPTGASESWSR